MHKIATARYHTKALTTFCMRKRASGYLARSTRPAIANGGTHTLRHIEAMQLYEAGDCAAQFRALACVAACRNGWLLHGPNNASRNKPRRRRCLVPASSISIPPILHNPEKKYQSNLRTVKRWKQALLGRLHCQGRQFNLVIVSIRNSPTPCVVVFQPPGMGDNSAHKDFNNNRNFWKIEE